MVKEAQIELGIPKKWMATSVAVICHEIKNLDKAILRFKAEYLTLASGLTIGRIKSMGKDTRDILGMCAAELRPLLDDWENNHEEIVKIAQRYRDEVLPKVITHHCGMCENCDPDFCRLKRIIDDENKLPAKDRRKLEHLKGIYLSQETKGLDGGSKRSRFSSFVNITWRSLCYFGANAV